MTSCHGKSSRISLWGASISQRWIPFIWPTEPSPNFSYAKLCFFARISQTGDKTVELMLNWDAITIIWRHSNVNRRSAQLEKYGSESHSIIWFPMQFSCCNTYMETPLGRKIAALIYRCAAKIHKILSGILNDVICLEIWSESMKAEETR